jgi:hypothetical protein
MKTGIVMLGLFLAAVSAHSQTDAPHAEIKNKQLKATIYLPGDNQFYKGVRFDWSGWIGDLEFQGHHLYRPWFQSVDPSVRDVSYKGDDIVVGPNTAMTGPAEEFQQPVGYDTAKPGETFLKIGVGILRKDNNDRYAFSTHFDIVDGGKWTVHSTSKSVTTEQVLGGPDKDYGYVYTKTIRLVGDTNQMVIEHHLKNTGKLPLVSRVYDHNFLTIDGLGVGSADSVTAGYDIHSTRPADAKFARIDGKTATYVSDLKGEDRVSFGLEGFSGDAKDYDYTVKNQAANVQVHIVGDHPVVNAMVWSIRSILAVEPFIQVQADPGKDFSWTYTYTYSSDKK